MIDRAKRSETLNEVQLVKKHKKIPSVFKGQFMC